MERVHLQCTTMPCSPSKQGRPPANKPGSNLLGPELLRLAAEGGFDTMQRPGTATTTSSTRSARRRALRQSPLL